MAVNSENAPGHNPAKNFPHPKNPPSKETDMKTKQHQMYARLSPMAQYYYCCYHRHTVSEKKSKPKCFRHIFYTLQISADSDHLQGGPAKVRPTYIF